MPDSMYERIFGCHHRRLTRPITPVTRPGVPSGETYVVCLDCGKQFAYDWDHMRMGEAIERSDEGGVLRPAPPKKRPKLKYALLGAAVPLGFLIGKAILSKREPRRAGPLPNAPDLTITSGRLRFRVGALVDSIVSAGRDYIAFGNVNCALADHPKPQSLDYWLRENAARNKDLRQVTGDVVRQLVATGLFEPADDLVCPDTGETARGLRLKANA